MCLIKIHVTIEKVFMFGRKIVHFDFRIVDFPREVQKIKNRPSYQMEYQKRDKKFELSKSLHIKMSIKRKFNSSDVN